nr:hypothetical protein [Marinicella sp. W31]MDC2877410.1 hypothetical protein [Marinicella sp. W31]
MMNFETARMKMVEGQIRTTDVTAHPVISAFLAVPREAFLSPELKPLSYIDEDIMVKPASANGPARYMMEPSPLAKLIQTLDVSKRTSFWSSAQARAMLRLFSPACAVGCRC